MLSEILFGSLGLGEVYLFRAVGKTRTFWSDLVAICGLFLLFLAGGPAFPGRALPDMLLRPSILRRLSQWLRFLGITSRLYSSSPSVQGELLRKSPCLAGSPEFGAEDVRLPRLHSVWKREGRRP